MNIEGPKALIIAVIMISISTISLFDNGNVEALPEGYPVWISGGYAVEKSNSTTYIDHLQPGSTENYLIHLFNDELEQVRYRVTITNEPEDWMVFLTNGGDETVVDLDPGKGKAVDLNMKTPTEMTGIIDLTIRNDNTMEEWDLSLEIVCERGPLIVSIPSTNYIVGRNTPSIFDITLQNIGNTVLNVTLDMEGMLPSTGRIDGTWTVVFSRRIVQIQPGKSLVVTAKVWPPELEPVGSQKVTILIAEVDGITRPFETGSISFKVQTIYDLRSSVTPIGYQKVAPGGSVEFTISIENWAIDYDTVSLSEFNKPSGWDIVFNDTLDPVSIPITIDPEGERIFHPVINLPRNAVAGKHVVELIAVGTTNTTYISLRVEVAREDSFELSTLTASGTDDTYKLTVGENILPIKIVNRGNSYDTVTLFIENRPEWAPLSFHSVKVGSGNNASTVTGAAGVNISGEFDRTLLFMEDTLTEVTISFDPSQTATVYLRADIPLGAIASSGVVGLKYRYGIFQEQKFLQASIKLILSEMEILDRDGDGAPDLDLEPLPDYEVGDTINFKWALKNNYPYETVGIKWVIELSGTVLIEGDVPPIAPGETMEFNRSWKVDKSTNIRSSATLKLTGAVYPIEGNAPSAKTDEGIYIEPGAGTPPYGLMFLFGGFMLILIGGFIGFFIWVRKDLDMKEAKERERYDAVYGMKRRPALGGETGSPDRRKRASSLGSSDRPELPSSSMGEGRKGRLKKRGLDDDRSGDEVTGKKTGSKRKAGSLGDLADDRSGPSKRKGPDGPNRSRIDDRPKKARKAPKLKELEVFEELEEMDET